MSIPPLFSSSPPPLDENGSICNDDFGEFSDHSSVGPVSSATSVNDSASAFRPIDPAELSCGLCLDESNPEPTNLQESDEWTDFDTAVVQHSSDIVQSDSTNSPRGQTLLAHKSLSGDVCVGTNPPDCITHETSTSELPNLYMSTSQVIVSELLNSADVTDSCCDDENSHNEELTVGNFDDDLCANVNTLSVDANPTCRVEEMLKDDDSSSVGDNCYYEFDNDVDLAVQENDAEDYNSFNESSVVAISGRSEHAFANDEQPASDENDFEDNFQSFSSYSESCQHTEAQSNSEEIASYSVYYEPECTASETETVLAYSVTKDLAMAAGHHEIVVADEPLTHEQMLTSNEQVDDDFDDFEEFVAAKQGPCEHLPTSDSTAYQWDAFESTAADGDEWAAFQDSDAPHTTNTCSEVATVNIADIQQPPVSYSGRLSKVYNI